MATKTPSMTMPMTDSAVASQQLVGPLLAKKPLREGGDEGDLDEEAEDRLDGRQDRDGVAGTLHRLEEAASVERRDAQHKRLVSGELVILGRRQAKRDQAETRDHEQPGEDGDDQHAGHCA